MNIIEDSRYAEEDLLTKKNLAYMLDVEEFQVMFKGYFTVSEPEDGYIKFKHGDKLINLYFHDINGNNIEDMETEYIDWYLDNLKKLNINLSPEWESVYINDYRVDKAVINLEIIKEITEIYFIAVAEKLVIFQTWFNEKMLPEEKEDIYMIINSFVEKNKANAYKQSFDYYNTPQYVDGLSGSFKYKNIAWKICVCIYFILFIGVPGIIDIYFKQDILLKNKEYIIFSSPVPNMFFELILILFISAAIFGIVGKKVFIKFFPNFMFNLSKIVNEYATYKSKGIKGEIFVLVVCLPLSFFSFNTYSYIDNNHIYEAGFFNIKAAPKYKLSDIKRIENKLLYFKSDNKLNYYIQIELENGKKLTDNSYLASIYLNQKDEEWVTETARSEKIKQKNKDMIKKIYFLVDKVKSINEKVIIQKEVEDNISNEVIEALKRELKISKEEEKYLSIYGITGE